MSKTLLSLLFFIFVAPQTAPAAVEGVVAEIGNVKITLNEFNEQYENVRRQSMNPPSKQLFLEDLVRYKLGLIEAEKRKLQNDPVVRERLNQELYKAFVEKAIGKEVAKIKVNEKEMRGYYQKNPELRTSHILIEVKPGATDKERAAAKKRAQEILSDVKKSKRSFEELVTLYTDDLATKAVGGDVGWQTRLTLVPSYYETAENLKVGSLSGLVETRFGFHIVKLTGRRAYRDANKRQIRAAVFDEKRRALFNSLFSDLKSKYRIKKYPSVIK